MTGAIIFDLDGTLVDSAPDLHAAANRMLGDFGKPALSLETVTSFIGNGIPKLVQLARLVSGLPEAEEDGMRAAMLRYYSANPADLTRPYDGVIDTLASLRAAGNRLGICTNKFRVPSLQILDALGLSRFFDTSSEATVFQSRRLPPPLLLRAFSDLAVASGLYIGDSEVDAATAENANTPFGLFTCGYRKTAVQDMRSTFTFDDYAELQDRIAGLR